MTADSGAGSAPQKSRAGKVLLVVGSAVFVLSWVAGVVTFFIPEAAMSSAALVLTVMLPGIIGFLGVTLAVVGIVLVLTRRSSTGS